MRVLLFGPLADLAGWRVLDLSPAPPDLESLVAALERRQPGLGASLSAKGVQVAVDKTLVRGPAALEEGAEIAFLPPMSGG